MPANYRRLRLVLGDQLNHQHSWWRTPDPHTLCVLMECRSETDYVTHHVQKVLGFFLAMRAFAKHLQQQGHTVYYIALDAPENAQSITANIQQLVKKYHIQTFEYQLPDEYRLDEALRKLSQTLGIDCHAVDSEHFLSHRYEVQETFAGKKTYLLETFYRRMRKKYQILMEADGDTPLTGRWNYDAENRKKLPRDIDIPPAPAFAHDASAMVQMLSRAGVRTIGRVVPEHFDWPVTRAESLQLLNHFVQIRLSYFGDYQDAMTERDPLLFHSKLSFAMNTKLLHPLEVVQACIAHWQQQPEAVSIAALEGFIRQIVGWREYMRGVYWAKMPAYATLNYFNHTAPLPAWYWTGDTKMNCLRHAIGQSLEHAYAHHIQRLMVTGNFALLLGVHPDEVDAWYLGIYMDAIEWVEITNTRGMSQFADGGIVGTKPYVSSANYIDKMSDYCQNCHYNKKAKYGERACPFNSLYWDFYDRHADRLERNPRIGMMYRTWAKLPPDERARILAQAAVYRAQADAL